MQGSETCRNQNRNVMCLLEDESGWKLPRELCLALAFTSLPLLKFNSLLPSGVLPAVAWMSHLAIALLTPHHRCSKGFISLDTS